LTIVDAMAPGALFSAAFRDTATWDAWRTALRAIFALPMSAADLALYRTCTGREAAPADPAREVFLVVGRRGGKSFVVAFIAVWLATKDYSRSLAPGERATIALIAADRQQARVLFRYVRGLLDAVPMLRRLVVRETASAIELENRVVIEVHTCSFRSTRGYSFAAVIADEAAFWRNDDSATPDVEVLNAVRPGLASIPGSLLLVISSPYARRGALWNAYRMHFGQDGDPVLVWKAETRTMNPTVPQHVIDTALADDEAAARAEWLAEFRTDVAAFITREVLDACVVPDRHELPPMPGTSYVAFTDPSGGSGDSFTLAIAHVDGDAIVLDLVRERTPPFSPDAVVAEYAATLKAYGLHTVTGDRYAGQWVVEAFAKEGIHYTHSEAPKSEVYGNLLPLLTTHRAQLLDHSRLLAQLAGLERRTARGGKDSIDHAPRSHDDVANAVAGALVLAAAELVGCSAPMAANLAPTPYQRIDWTNTSDGGLPRVPWSRSTWGPDF